MFLLYMLVTKYVINQVIILSVNVSQIIRHIERSTEFILLVTLIIETNITKMKYKSEYKIEYYDTF